MLRGCTLCNGTMRPAVVKNSIWARPLIYSSWAFQWYMCFPGSSYKKKILGLSLAPQYFMFFLNSFKLSSYMQSTVSLYGCAFDPLNGLTFVCGRIFDRDTLIFIWQLLMPYLSNWGAAECNPWFRETLFKRKNNITRALRSIQSIRIFKPLAYSEISRFHEKHVSSHDEASCWAC